MHTDLPQRMADRFVVLLNEADPTDYTHTGPRTNTRYKWDRIKAFIQPFGYDAILGDVPPGTTVSELVRRYESTRALVETGLHQRDYVDASGAHRLSFVSEVLTRIQTELVIGAVGRDVVLTRAVTTSPRKGMKPTYNRQTGEEIHAFGWPPGVDTTSLDAFYDTFRTPTGAAESISLGGLVSACDNDRNAWVRDPSSPRLRNLTPLQHLSLTRPTAAMLGHLGAVLRTQPEDAGARLVLIRQGRHEGPGESQWLRRSTKLVCIVNESGYAEAARRSAGDAHDLVVAADGPPEHPGLEAHHVYVEYGHRDVRATYDNAKMRERLRVNWRGLEWALRVGQCVAEMRNDGFAVLLPGELRSTLEGGAGDRGQALLVFTQHGPPQWFSVLLRSDGSPAWTGNAAEIQQKLDRFAAAFDLAEGSDSIAGARRREHFSTLEDVFNVSLSDPAGREFIWRLASVVRQAHLPEGTFAGPLMPA